MIEDFPTPLGPIIPVIYVKGPINVSFPKHLKLVSSKHESCKFDSCFTSSYSIKIY